MECFVKLLHFCTVNLCLSRLLSGSTCTTQYGPTEPVAISAPPKTKVLAIGRDQDGSESAIAHFHEVFSGADTS